MSKSKTLLYQVLCIGMNYRDHCEEQGAPVPKEPLVFNKFPSCKNKQKPHYL